MADRQVTRSGKDRDGDITRLCNPSQAWSPCSKADAIRDIEAGTHRYYVQQLGTQPTLIHVVAGQTGKYLRTGADGAPANNLDNLPDC